MNALRGVSARRIGAVLFDLDGTLLDTAADMVDVLNQQRQDRGHAPLPYATVRCQVSHGSQALIKIGFPGLDAASFEQHREEFLSRYAARIALHTQLFPGFEAVLSQFETQGLPWGIVTNKPGFLTAPLLQALGLDLRSGCTVSGDSLPQRKPHPAPLLFAAARLGVAPERCLYVGDAERDIKAARASGMPSLIAGFGYLGPDDQPDQWGADGQIDTPQALLDWLEKNG